MPQLKLEDDCFLEVIYEMKLVGIYLTSDLKWDKHKKLHIVLSEQSNLAISEIQTVRSTQREAENNIYIENKVNPNV